MWLGNDILALILLIMLTAFAATGLGMLIAALAKTRSQATGITILLVLTMSALGGSWWPLYIVPTWMQQAAHITLTAWAMDGFNQLLIYGKTFTAILLPLTVLALIGIVSFTTAIARFKFD